MTFLSLIRPWRLSRFAAGLLVANIVVFVVLSSTIAYSLIRSHEAYLASARQTSANLAHTLGLSVGAEIKQIDNALQSVVLQLANAADRGGPSLQKITSAALEQKTLVPQVDVIRVTDAQGNVLNAGQAMSVADRSYFSAVRLHPDRLAMSEPLQGRITRKWGVVLARARLDAQGKFQGIVYSNLSSDRLIDEFDDIGLGAHGAVALRTESMRLVARYTPGMSNPHANLGTAEVSSQLRAAVASSPAMGSFISVTAVDGMRRMNAFERVPGYSLVVYVGVSTDEFFAPWVAEVRSEVSLSVLLEIFIIGLSVRIGRQHARQAKSERDALNLAEERQALLDNQLVGMVKLEKRCEVWHNRALGLLFGYAHGELAGRSARILYPDDETYEQVGAAYGALAEHGQLRMQVRMVRKDGSLMWIDLSGARLPDGQSLWMMVDISAVKDSETQARHQASHDSLTGLLNRAALLDRMKVKLAEAEFSAKPLAVCYIDLDGFKIVNDRHGHEAGDRLLNEVAQRLMSAVRVGDLVARLGGDEFVAVLCELHGDHEVPVIADRIRQALSRPIDLRGGSQALVGASIGIAVYPRHGGDVDLLLRHSDAAMYEAKRSGKNGFVVYTEEADTSDGHPGSRSQDGMRVNST